MTARQFVEIEKQLLPHLPGFRIKGSLMVLRPSDHLLRAIAFERSINRDAFYVWKFVMPLCVPQRYIHFQFGERIRDSQNRGRWTASAPGLIEELALCLKASALPFLNGVQSLMDLVELARPRYAADSNVIQAMAFSLARDGRTAEAVALLDERLPLVEPVYPYEFENKARCLLIRDLLENDPAAAQVQLAAWEDETVRNLGLEELRETK